MPTRVPRRAASAVNDIMPESESMNTSPNSPKPAAARDVPPPSPPPAATHFRLAAVFHRPHIYFCQFLQRVAARPGIDLTVYFYTSFGLGSTPDPHFGRTLYPAA